MEKMQYRGFVFPHNPEEIKISLVTPTKTHLLPQYGEIQESLGKGLQKIECKGSFWGENPNTPFTKWQQFLSVVEESPTGLLFLPYQKPLFVSLKQYAISATDDGCVLPYTLLFMEVSEHI